VVGFACEWRTDLEHARLLGRRVGRARYLEVRYEELVEDARGVVESICAFAVLPFEPAMLEFADEVDVSAKPHQQRLLQPLTSGARNWRTEMSSEDLRAFESIAGDVLDDLGYELGDPSTVGSMRRAPLTWYRARALAWSAAVTVAQRSPLWKRRHPLLF
jgi:hypothetical protein